MHEFVDKSLMRKRFRRALAARRPGADFLLEAAGVDLAERLAGVERNFAAAIVHAALPGPLARRLATTGRVGGLALLAPCRSEQDHDGPAAVADEERLPLAAASIDLFVSALLLQFANDLPGALVQIRRALRPDGLFLAVVAAGDTLRELREALLAAETELTGGASPRVLPAADLRDLGGLLQRAGFALPVVDRDVLTVRYDHLFALMADLRAMGAANPLVDRTRRPASRAFFARAAAIYAERFADPNGRIRATFELVSLSGWAPHDSQQQPARRGSATVSLADALAPRGDAKVRAGQ